MLEELHEVKIRIGRRFLPLIATLFSYAADERLKTYLGKNNATELPNPIILDSYYSRAKEWNAAIKLGFGAVTTKTTTVSPRKGYDHPRIIPVGEGYVNCEGLPNPGMDGMKKEIEKFYEINPKGRLIVSITFLDDVSDLKKLARNFLGFGAPLEINISSPNAQEVYKLSRKPQMLRRALTHAREASDETLGIKVSPDFAEENFRYVIPIAIESGLDYIKWGNTMRVKEPRLSIGYGGLSGPEIYNQMRENIMRAYNEFGKDIDFIAAGGIDSPEKAFYLLSHGVKAVALLSAFPKIPYRDRHGFLIAQRINRELVKKYS